MPLLTVANTTTNIRTQRPKIDLTGSKRRRRRQL